MRVITGKARGRKLAAPAGLEVRPTSEVTKEGVFSAIQFEIEQASFLDLFAGSGQIGIEALSRGAKSCVFVDKNRESQQIIRRNLEHTGLFGSARLAQMDAVSYLNTITERFDIAFVDPPYAAGLMEKVLPVLSLRMTDGGVIICETEKKQVLPQRVGDFEIYREYGYGKAKVTIYRKPKSDEE